MRAMIDTLESRQLLAAADPVVWSQYAQLIGQDVAATTYPTLTGKGQVIAEIDTGIDYTHPNLGGGFGPKFKVIGGYDFVDNDSDPMDHSEDGHGTLVAGMIAGSRFTQTTVDAQNVSHTITYQGIAPDAKLVALRTGTEAGGFTDQNLTDAFNWIAANYKKYGITIVNMSIGGGEYTKTETQKIFAPETKKLRDLGIAVIAAAGNSGDTSGDTIERPAAEPSIYAIGALNADGQISYFSNRNNLLDLFAPGEDVTTTKFGGGYDTVSGTSFSSPLTAGVFALINQATGGSRPQDVMSILRTSSKTQYDGDGDPGITTDRSYAQLDIPQAIALAQSRTRSAKLLSFAATKTTTSDAAYDANGVLHLAYYDTSTHKLMYSARLTTGRWTTPIMVDHGTDVGQFASIAIDPTGKPGIAYYDAANQDMKYAWFNGSKWANTTLDSSKSVGQYTSLAYTAAGDPAIAYYRKTTGDLRLMTYSHVTDSWTRQTIESADDVGQSTSIATFREKTNPDDSTVDFYDTLAIAYGDATTGNLRYWSRGTPLSGTPYISQTTVDDIGGIAHTSLALLDVDGKATPRIAYQDTANADVKFAYRKSGDWKKVNVATSGTVGASVGSYVDTAGAYHVVYFDSTKKASYDAAIDGTAVDHITRLGTLGANGSVAGSSDGVNVTLIGLNSAGKSLDDLDID